MFNEPRTSIFRWNAIPVTVMSWNALETGKNITFKISVCHIEKCITADLYLVLLTKTCICTNNSNSSNNNNNNNNNNISIIVVA